MTDVHEPPTTVAPLLSVESLRVVVTGTGNDVVDEVSFAVRAGEVMGLVGESGSGKTTVALALMGHTRRGLTIDSGKVLLAGDDILVGKTDLRELRGASVSYVAQDPVSALNPALKVGTQLREIFDAHPDVRPPEGGVDGRIADVLADVRLDSVERVLDSYPHQLSGGQQQRVMLGMAFACRPKLIILDEPTTGLDVTTQRHILETIRTLCGRYQVGAVYVSHDLAVVADIASTIGIMYAGRLIEHGSVAAAFRAPAHPYTRGLLRAIPDPSRAHVLEGMEGQPPRPGSRPRGCSFAPRCSFSQPACLEGFPLPVAIGAEHWARCLRAEEITVLPPLGELPERDHSGKREGTAPLLEVKSLDAQYGEKPVLHDVSLDVRPHRCLAVVGESGAGKTTFARCLVGLHSRWTGEMAFGGESLSNDRRKRSREQIRRMQYVFQNPYTSLNPRKTVGQLVEQPLRELLDINGAQRRERVVTALEEAALNAGYADRYPDQLSGGERQRVAIARALVVEPELLICDEVTSALDVSVQAAIVELLHRLQVTRGLTLVLITHNLALVRSIADDVVILRDGLVVEQGQTVLDNPQSEYAVQLMADVPTLSVAAHG
ncbi:MAG TPA: ABC transporter ATP-binding protein [Solirubrobacteraceae bacterium]|nr:ABC transporter ATP-binding protein [Solirubrobacteraceae bacterium]